MWRFCQFCQTSLRVAPAIATLAKLSGATAYFANNTSLIAGVIFDPHAMREKNPFRQIEYKLFL
jgi:hypothetical protein